MAEYEVEYAIDIFDHDSPLEAAETALLILRDTSISDALHFRVTDAMTGEVFRVDLGTGTVRDGER